MGFGRSKNSKGIRTDDHAYKMHKGCVCVCNGDIQNKYK